MTNAAAREILVAGARARAHADGLGGCLQVLLAAVAEQLEVESAAIFILDREPGHLEIAASTGLGDSD